jgi:hypothetical protein
LAPGLWHLELWSDVSEVVGHDEGGRKNGPDGHLNSRLVEAEAEIADDELQRVNDKAVRLDSGLPDFSWSKREKYTK